jgi:hypothetical protein
MCMRYLARFIKGREEQDYLTPFTIATEGRRDRRWSYGPRACNAEVTAGFIVPRSCW